MTPILGEGFQLLYTQLAADPSLAEEKYKKLRARLVKLMECNGIQNADDLADEALTRVARKLAEGESIRSIEAYTARVAQIVRLEMSHRKPSVSIDDEETGVVLSTNETPETDLIEQDDEINRERKLACMRNCFGATLSTDERDFMSNYVLTRSGKTPAMRKRAQRIRERLQECVHNFEKAK